MSIWLISIWLIKVLMIKIGDIVIVVYIEKYVGKLKI